MRAISSTTYEGDISYPDKESVSENGLGKKKKRGVVHSNKEVSDTKIRCGETFRVTLSLTASPDIESHPTDIVFLLDRSGSMAGSPPDHLKPGATEIVVRDTISPCFRVQSVETPTKGTAKKADDTSVLWEIEALGVKGSEGASLTFTVEHIGPCTGLIEVNRSVSYQDHEGIEVVFPSPKIEVRCDEPTPPECPDAVEITIGGCTDTVEYNAGDLQLDDLGRILLPDVKLKNVCPHKRVALAVILTEVDAKDEEHPRGTKTMVIPAHTGSVCRDVAVRCIRFVLPEELDVSGTPGGICNERHFLARFIAHYIDSDFTCCRTTV